MADVFLDLDNVTGESLDYDHMDEIEVYGWNWGISNDAPFSLHGKSDGTPHATVQHLTIEKFFDSASVTLAQFCALGTHIEKGYFACRKNTSDNREASSDYLTIELTDIKVLSIDWPAKTAGEHAVTETVVLQFAHFDLAYKKQANEGQLYGRMNFEFDVPEGKAAAAKA